MRRPPNIWLAAGVVAALALAACDKDDGASIRGCSAEESNTCADATGIASQVAGSMTEDPVLLDALARYKAYVLEQVDDTIANTEVFADAVRAGDVEAAKAAYAPSRQGWERIEPVASLISAIDAAIDSRVDDFEGVDDPNFTGWHKLEYLLWEVGSVDDGGAALADHLERYLQALRTDVQGMDIPAAALPAGTAELIEEVSTGKITGEEDRYSHTDLWDFAANVDGAEQGFELLEPAIVQADPELATTIEALFAKLDRQLAEYEDGQGGYLSYEALTEDDKAAMQTTLAELSEHLSTLVGVLDITIVGPPADTADTVDSTVPD